MFGRRVEHPRARKKKAKYGFESVDDWPRVADYTGPFRYEGGQRVGEWRDDWRRNGPFLFPPR